MSITEETLKQHLKDPAVLCCRREKGTVISAQDLEDPSLFDDMVDAGLVTLSDDGLTIEEVVGATLAKDSEALIQLTSDLLEGVKKAEAEAPKPAPKPEHTPPAPPVNHGMIEVEIAKLEGLKLKLPANLGIANAPVPAGPPAPPAETPRGEKK